MKKIQLISVFGAILLLMPAYASAATVYLQASRTVLSVGDTAVISVKIDADGAVLNSVQGDIVIGSSPASVSPDDVTVQQFSLANSAFGLWPRTPSLSANGRDISFVGGVPGGFSIEGATLFNIIVQATKAGTVTVSPQNMSVFANDGKGTTVSAQLKNITLTVIAAKSGTPPVNDWANTLATDTTPPAPFIIVLAQDPSLYSGNKFAYFSSVDDQSGIDHYEVSENGGAFVRSGSTYVLQDQTGPVVLNVVAYDKAGNKTAAAYPAGGQNQSGHNAAHPASSALAVSFAVIGILVILVLAVIYGKWRKNGKNRSKDAPKE